MESSVLDITWHRLYKNKESVKYSIIDKKE